MILVTIDTHDSEFQKKGYKPEWPRWGLIKVYRDGEDLIYRFQIIFRDRDAVQKYIREWEQITMYHTDKAVAAYDEELEDSIKELWGVANAEKFRMPLFRLEGDK